MICYKDMTFCPFWKKCKEGLACKRALTSLVKADAKTWWGGEGAPICQYAEKPGCFKELK